MNLNYYKYNQHKTKLKNIQRLFPTENLLDSNKLISSTLNQSENETFSLHLSESYVDETQESINAKSKQDKEVIMISDSSTDESISSNCNVQPRKFQGRKGIYILESSDEESFQVERADRINGISEISQKVKEKVVIQESESEVEENSVPELIKETITESVKLSERKKVEILRWLSTNFEGSRCGSSCSQDESAISNSRKSGTSSGNSSLERLELNFETPNNRGKISRPTTAEKCISRVPIQSEGQSTLDRFLIRSKKRQFQIAKDKTPGSKKSDKTITNNIKTINGKIILSDNDSRRDRTPNSRTSDKTPVNRINVQPRRIIIPESQSFDSNDSLAIDNDLSALISDKPINQKTPVISPKTSNFKSNIKDLENFSDLNLKNTKNQKTNQTPKSNTSINTTINDCADILENLYGTTWRNKASTLISATDLKKPTTKKFIRGAQTEKKITFRKPIFNYDSDSELSDKENYNNKQTNNPKVTPLQTTNRTKAKDSFINDESTESSPDCSYYTALSNPVSSQINYPKNGLTPKPKTNNKNVAICDSDSSSSLDNKYLNTKRSNQRKLSFDSSSDSLTSEFEPGDVVPPKIKTKNIKTNKLDNFEITKSKDKPVARSFLASLSKDVPLNQADFKAVAYRVKYNVMKEELCKYLYKLFNEKVFDNKLPDDMLIEWSVRLRGTAGKCYNKQSLKALGKTVRSSRIVLATKILDSPDRLRDTLIHEMCHAATWLINNVSDGHGSFWKAWATKAVKTFPELPPIARCHNYEIQTKYTYRCTNCAYSFGRHSKSLDLDRKRCGYCHGSFELLINKFTKDGKIQKKSTAQTKQPSGFALYVKENYNIVKESVGAKKHGEIMKILGQQFSAVKLTPKPAEKTRNSESEALP